MVVQGFSLVSCTAPHHHDLGLAKPSGHSSSALYGPFVGYLWMRPAEDSKVDTGQKEKGIMMVLHTVTDVL